MLFIIFGWGKQTSKFLNEINYGSCDSCHKDKFRLIKSTSWFTIFFIPVIPYDCEYFLVCPSCVRAYEVDEEMIENNDIKWKI